MNMSYCQFENTLKALQQVMNSLSDCENYDQLIEEMSTREKNSVRPLIKLCEDIALDFGSIEETDFLPED